MKYIVVLADGMADYPLEELSGKTPLEQAQTPNLDYLAAHGTVGLVSTVPTGFPPGSDVANLSVMGYDPVRYYTGRSPLEAVSIGVQMRADDVAFRCNLVTLSDHDPYEKKIMLDYSAGEISSPEAAQIIQDVNRAMGNAKMSFYAGVSYRNLLIWHGGEADGRYTPPHDILEQPITDYLPQGPGSEQLLAIMEKSYELLVSHPVNIARQQKGLRPANSLWFWGQGKKPALPLFKEMFGIQGGVISAVDLIRGIGLCAGMQVIEVPGITGNLHTNFTGKAMAAVEALRQGLDFVYVHIEAPDEAAHQGVLADKIAAIEKIDSLVVGPILQEMAGEEFSLLVLPDHPTPLCKRTHTADPVPFVIYRSTATVIPGGTPCFNETIAAQTGHFVKKGHELLPMFFNN
ncbi:MAG: cofactor-independent phosphoglycerate mutase [Bacillota bacterium]|uniref:cofactor-independent phosphoglycerate mutase n=1 Tax=Desulfurispora thermophila TaxID=265470 RepID=UPI00037B541C|nr:cofactor-independent phosphoglycerate mutase [Desulfurispora thermophila]